MYAVISDLHANREALQAVLADIAAQGIDEVLCLGDVVGYGPDPLACVDLVMQRVQHTVMGNHEEALIHGAYGFHLRAAQAIEWTRDMLKPGFFSGIQVRRRWDFVCGLPLRHERGPDLFIHGSPRQPTSEYVLRDEVAFRHEKYSEIFAACERLLFVGHSHLPCVITDGFEVRAPEQLDGCFRLGSLGERKAIINVGSVGQPRDGDNRACYVVVDEEQVRWRRVPYDFKATMDKVAAADALHPSLGERLALGR